MRRLVAPEERHKRLGKRGKPLKEGFERWLTTDRVAEQDGDKVQHVEGAGATTGETHALADRVEMALLGKVASEQDDFGKPGRNRGCFLRRGRDGDSWFVVAAHRQLLQCGRKILPGRSMEDAAAQALLAQAARCATRGAGMFNSS
jgi:hypothetical protein